MRHLRSILYALVLAPTVWVLAGVGFTHDLSSRGRELFAAESISGLLLLIFAGILYAILAFSPISPAGPVLAGAAYLGVTIWAFNSPGAYAGLWAPEVSKEGFDLSRPGYGLAGLLAIPLLATALSARRWARYEPPVLPIIGELSLFRGKAAAPGIPMSIAETTVLRAGVPISADRTVAIPPPATDPTPAAAVPTAAGPTAAADAAAPGAGARAAGAADPTVAVPAAADRTVAMSASDQTAPVPAATDATVAIPASDQTAPVPAAADRTVTVPASDQAAAVPPPADATVALPARAAAASPAATSSAPEPAGKLDDDETERLPRPSEDPATNATQALPSADATQALPPADATQVLPAVDATPGSTRTGTVTPPGNLTEPIKLPTPDDATTLIPAQRRPPSIES